LADWRLCADELMIEPQGGAAWESVTANGFLPQ
jgi:hypothetical protein